MKTYWVPLLALLVLAGCVGDDTDTPEACRYAAINALDQGRWDRALNLLEHRQCQAAFTVEERELNMAAARIGRAGYDPVDVVNELLKTDPAGTNSGDRIVAAFSEMARGKRESMTDLDRAQAHYQRILDATVGQTLRTACADENSIAALTDAGKDACFYNGLVAAVKSAGTVSVLLGEVDNLLAWLSDGSALTCDLDRNRNGITDSAELSACAMEIAAGGVTAGSNGICGINNDIAWQAEAEPVVFPSANGNSAANLMPITFTVPPASACGGYDNHVGYHLIDIDDGRSILTNGYCAASDLASEHNAANPALDIWPCPLFSADGRPLSADETLVEALNEDAEQFIALLPAKDRAEARKQLNDFRSEICDEAPPHACDRHPDGSIAAIHPEALRGYLQRSN